MTKWEKGPVKLVNGEEAWIDAINEEQEEYRYTGRIRGSRGIWIAAGWHANGRYMYAHTDHSCNLAPPPKKTVRVKAMTDQEILSLIDAEIAASETACKKLKRATPGYTESLCGHIGFINGLRAARALNAKRTEEVTF